MKKITLILCLFVLGAGFTLKSQEMTDEQKIWYAIGVAEGQNFKNFGFEFSEKLLLEGIYDAIAGTEKYNQDELQAIFMTLQQKMDEKMKKDIEEEKEKGQKFLAENRNRKGVIETESGLQYEVIKMGDGPKPSSTDMVKVHYHGTTIDGTVFDSSVDRDEPAQFPLNQVIKGWTEGVQLMPVGSKFKFYIPSSLAYGDMAPRGANFKGGATLVFEVELIEIVKE